MFYQGLPYLPVAMECGSWSRVRCCLRHKNYITVKDKYAIAVKNGEQTVGHIPMFLSKLTFFFLRYDGKVLIKVNRPRRYSVDLIQGGLELPAEFIFKLPKKNFFLKCKKRHWLRLKNLRRRGKKWKTR